MNWKAGRIEQVFLKEVFLKIPQNSQVNTCVGVSYFNKSPGLKPEILVIIIIIIIIIIITIIIFDKICKISFGSINSQWPLCLRQKKNTHTY